MTIRLTGFNTKSSKTIFIKNFTVDSFLLSTVFAFARERHRLVQCGVCGVVMRAVAFACVVCASVCLRVYNNALTLTKTLT